MLLDGLDEVIDDKARDAVAKKINHFVLAFPDNRYVVTCRTAGWREALLTGRFTRVLIRDFSEADAQRFVVGWYRAVRTRGAGASRPEARKGGKRGWRGRNTPPEKPRLWSRPCRPTLVYRSWHATRLILSLIALVHYRRRDLPKGRAKLYQECLEILLDVWDGMKELTSRDISLKAKESSLQRNSLTSSMPGHHGGQRRRSGTPDRCLCCRELDCSLSARQALSQIEERSGILVTSGSDRYTFAHRTLQEYLTAKVLVTTPNRSAETAGSPR